MIGFSGLLITPPLHAQSQAQAATIPPGSIIANPNLDPNVKNQALISPMAILKPPVPNFPLPGRWKFEASISPSVFGISSLPIPTQCLTTTELHSEWSKLLSSTASNALDAPCKEIRFSMHSGKVNSTFQCQQSHGIALFSVDGTYTNKSFNLRIKSTNLAFPEGSVLPLTTLNQKGTWSGQCTK